MYRIAQAARQSPRRYTPFELPAPYLGWNVRDSVDGLPLGFARILDNFFPFRGYVQLRGGQSNWATGFGGNAVETLARWASTTTRTVLAAAGTDVYTVPQSSTPVSIGTGFSSARWQVAEGGVKGSANAVFMANDSGADVPQVYDGTTLAAVAWTAVGTPTYPLTLTQIDNVMVANNLIFLADQGRLGFWHSVKGSISDAAQFNFFPLEGTLPRGSVLYAMGTMTVDGGGGPDDYYCFLSTSGFCAVYTGTDPAFTNNWRLVGVYNIGAPLGKRGALQIGGDLVFMTTNGYISMRQFIQIGGLSQQSFLFNNYIQPEVVTQANDFALSFGWQAVLHPDLTLALFNVPQAQGYDQHIINTETGAWSRLKDLQGNCWLSFDDFLLFGTNDGRVQIANSGTQDDNGAPVRATALSSFSNMGSPGLSKIVGLYRPIIRYRGSASFATQIKVDYDENITVSPGPVTAPSNIAEWNSSEWDAANWGGGLITDARWRLGGVRGHAAAVALVVDSYADDFEWSSTDMQYARGGTI